MKVCIVIGGAGFIGRHVVKLLCESGRNVIVLGRSPQPDRSLDQRCRYISGDYGNRAVLRNILSAGAEVIDLAYSTVPKTSYDDAAFDLISNLPASVGLFQECIAVGVGKLIVVSSGGTVYGPTTENLINENHSLSPVSPYGITKMTTDRYALMFHRNNKLPVVIVRPANAYGREQRSGTGQGFIANAIDAILSDRDVEVYGVNGTIRDYIHVIDIASGLMAALKFGENGQIYNLGTGIGTSNAEIIEMLKIFALKDGIMVRTKILPMRNFDVEANILDSTKIIKLCGWKPEITLFNGLREMWNERKSKI